MTSQLQSGRGTPSLDEAWQAWTTITTTADPWLDTLTTEQVVAPRTFTVGERIPQVRALLRRIAPVRRDASAQRATTRPERQ
jgi:hypothetical protein